MVFAQVRHQLTRVLGSTLLLTSLAVVGGLVGLRQLGALESMELDAYDRFIRLKPQEKTDQRILVVGIEETDIQKLQQYPIHDATLAKALTMLNEVEPRVIGIDIARDVPQGPLTGRANLTQILSESEHIVSACLLSSSYQPGVPPAPGTPPDLVGFADLPEDIGGVIRRSILVSAPAPPPVTIGEVHLCNDDSPENEVLSLSLLLSLIYLEGENIGPEQTNRGELKLSNTVLKRLNQKTGGYIANGATDYQVMLNYRGNRNAVRQVSLMDLLENQVDPSWIRDRVVLIGYTSQVANDIFITPYSETRSDFRGMAGVVVHAQATSQLLSAVLDQRRLISSLPEILEWIWIWDWALLGGLIAIFSKRLPFFLMFLGLTVGITWLLTYGLFLHGLWLPIVPAVLALTITSIGVNLMQKARQGGYLQAIREQLRDQLQGRSMVPQQGVDYLENLVQRAKAIREGSTGEIGDTAFNSAIHHMPTSPASALSLQFDSADTQSIYEQIKAEVEQEKAAEESRQRKEAQRRQVDHLLKKAKTTRIANSSPYQESAYQESE